MVGTGSYGVYSAKLEAFGGSAQWLGLHDHENHGNSMCAQLLESFCGSHNPDALSSCCVPLECGQGGNVDTTNICGTCSETDLTNVTIARWCAWNEVQFHVPNRDSAVLFHVFVATLVVLVVFPAIVAVKAYDKTAIFQSKGMQILVAHSEILLLFSLCLSGLIAGSSMSVHGIIAFIITTVWASQGVLRRALGKVIPQNLCCFEPHWGVMLALILLPFIWILGVLQTTHICQINGTQCSAHVGIGLPIIVYGIAALWVSDMKRIVYYEVFLLLTGGSMVAVAEYITAHPGAEGRRMHLLNEWSMVKWQHFSTALSWAICGALHFVHARSFPHLARQGIAPAVAILVHSIMIAGHAKPDTYNTVFHRAHALVFVVGAIFRLRQLTYMAGVMAVLAGLIFMTSSIPSCYYLRYIVRVPPIPALVLVLTFGVGIVLIQATIRSFVEDSQREETNKRIPQYRQISGEEQVDTLYTTKQQQKFVAAG